MKNRIKELEEMGFGKMCIVAFLVGDTSARTLDMGEQKYISDYLDELYEGCDTPTQMNNSFYMAGFEDGIKQIRGLNEYEQANPATE